MRQRFPRGKKTVHRFKMYQKSNIFEFFPPEAFLRGCPGVKSKSFTADSLSFSCQTVDSGSPSASALLEFSILPTQHISWEIEGWAASRNSLHYLLGLKLAPMGLKLVMPSGCGTWSPDLRREPHLGLGRSTGCGFS